MLRVSKAPSGLNRHKYVCLQASLQHHILCSVDAKHPFDTLIIKYRKERLLWQFIRDTIRRVDFHMRSG